MIDNHLCFNRFCQFEVVKANTQIFFIIHITSFLLSYHQHLLEKTTLFFFSRFLRHSHDVFQIGTIVVPKKFVMYLEVITYRYVVRTAHSGYVCICHQLEKSKKCSALFILILPNGSVLYNFTHVCSKTIVDSYV